MMAFVIISYFLKSGLGQSFVFMICMYLVSEEKAIREKIQQNELNR